MSNQVFEVHLLPLYGGIDLCRSEKVLNSLPHPSLRLNISILYLKSILFSTDTVFNFLVMHRNHHFVLHGWKLLFYVWKCIMCQEECE